MFPLIGVDKHISTRFFLLFPSPLRFQKNSVVFNKFDFVNIDNLKSAYSDKIFRKQGLIGFYGFQLGKQMLPI